MKTARLLLVLLALFGFTSLSDAQEVSKSGREKGFVIRPEIGINSGWVGKSDQLFGYFLQGSVDYQFNSYFEAGIGTGFHHYKWHFSGEREKVGSVPVYANIRAYLCNTMVSPFFDFKIGYNIPHKEGCIQDEYKSPLNLWHNSDLKIEGLYGMLSFGLQAGGMDVGISTGWVQGMAHSTDQNQNNDVKDHTNWYFMTAFSIAYNFHFK